MAEDENSADLRTEWRKSVENRQLDMDRILTQVDALYEQNRGEEAEQIGRASCRERV